MDGHYPSVDCPECGSGVSDVEHFLDATRQAGPGERAMYRCYDCGWLFETVVPEPPDNYEGDGVFAESH